MDRHNSENLDRLRDAQNADAEALGKLLEFYRPWLMERTRISIEKALRVKVSDSDLVQDTFVQALEHFSQFRGTTASELRNWLAAIMKHQLADAMRQFQAARMRDVYREMTLSKAEKSAKNICGDKPSPALIERLLAAVEKLPYEQRDIVWARYLEGKSFEAIAVVCK